MRLLKGRVATAEVRASIAEVLAREKLDKTSELRALFSFSSAESARQWRVSSGCGARRCRDGTSPFGHYCMLVGEWRHYQQGNMRLRDCFPVEASSDVPGLSAGSSSDQA